MQDSTGYTLREILSTPEGLVVDQGYDLPSRNREGTGVLKGWLGYTGIWKAPLN